MTRSDALKNIIEIVNEYNEDARGNYYRYREITYLNCFVVYNEHNEVVITKEYE